jgi:hypothetical protein
MGERIRIERHKGRPKFKEGLWHGPDDFTWDEVALMVAELRRLRMKVPPRLLELLNAQEVAA